MSKNLNKRALAYIVLLLGLLLFIVPYKSALLFNKSNSLQHRVYLLIKGKNWKKYDLVGIKGFKTIYTKNQHFTKRVIGVAGDVITIKNDWVFINEQKIAELKLTTKKGQTLSPIKEQIIPQQYFFVVADHQDSFDSRYQEFGLVREDYIEGKAYPVW